MASCKHIRWCASLLHHSRGRGFSTQSLEEDITSGLLAALQPHVDDAGKPLLSDLANSWRNEREAMEKETEALEKQRTLISQLLENERQFSAQRRVDLLKARGRNDTRGLFEFLQENLAGKSYITPSSWRMLKGAALWEAILMANAGLAACIQKCTNMPASDVVRQGVHCYNVYSLLSQHVHAGKSLAELEVGQGGTIKFERGPLSSEQVQVLLCLGKAAQVALDVNAE